MVSVCQPFFIGKDGIPYSYHFTGYKQREKLSRSLKARVDAIQSALKRYNEAAAQLNPPRSALSWEAVMSAVTVADFDLLRDTRQDIRTLEWAQPANREGTVMYFGIKRAKEEICRLNVEIHRLLTFLYDDYADHFRAVTKNIIINPPVATEISSQWSYRERIHETIVKRLIQTSRLPGFTGNLFPGQRVGRDPELNENIPPPSWVTHLLGITTVEVEFEYDEETDNIQDLEPEEEVDTVVFVELLEELAIR